MNKTITIIGAGIAGLSTAIALQNKGFTPILFERAKQFKPVGAGIALAANAMLAYQEMGIAQDIILKGKMITRFDICDQRGKPILESNNVELNKVYNVQNYAIHRADLHNIILSKIPSSNIHLGKEALDIEESYHGIKIQFQDGSTHLADTLIVADGIHSKIRQKLVPKSSPRYAGYTCWRGVIYNSKLDIPYSTESWGKGKRFGIVPLQNNRIYWFACINATQNNPTYKNYKIDDLLRAFSDFHHPIPELLKNTNDSQMIWNDIIDIAPISQYAFNQIVLIGDAAHATTPNMGQGACQGIEDAIILANELARHSSMKEAFQSFEKRRLKRTHHITNTSWRIGKLAHWENDILRNIRNFLLRKVPDRMNQKNIEFLYNVDFN